MEWSIKIKDESGTVHLIQPTIVITSKPEDKDTLLRILSEATDIISNNMGESK